MTAAPRRSIVDGCAAAQARGATVVTFSHDDPHELGELLTTHRARTRLICIDGVNSLTGATADLGSLAMLARANDALLYIDDEAGFGVLGERGPDELCAYGKRGNSIVRHFGESYDNIVLVAGFSKAYSSLLTFLALPTALKQALRSAAPVSPHPTPMALAAVATVLEGLAVNERRGDALRLELHRMTARVLAALAELGVRTQNTNCYPVIEIPLVQPTEAEAVGRFLRERGIFATLARTAAVPRTEAEIRIQLTSANTDHQVSQLVEALGALAERFQIDRRGSGGGARRRHPRALSARRPLRLRQRRLFRRSGALAGCGRGRVQRPLGHRGAGGAQPEADERREDDRGPLARADHALGKAEVDDSGRHTELRGDDQGRRDRSRGWRGRRARGRAPSRRSARPPTRGCSASLTSVRTLRLAPSTTKNTGTRNPFATPET